MAVHFLKSGNQSKEPPELFSTMGFMAHRELGRKHDSQHRNDSDSRESFKKGDDSGLFLEKCDHSGACSTVPPSSATCSTVPESSDRTHKFTRVSEDTLVLMEMSLRRQADELIRSHPAKGSTIKP
jgi:hypothetical protein